MPNPTAHASFLCSWILVLEISVCHRKKSLSLKADFLQEHCVSSPDLYCKLTELQKLHFGKPKLVNISSGGWEDREMRVSEKPRKIEKS